jgi:adenylyltransferase/sulfurtransferase
MPGGAVRQCPARSVIRGAAHARIRTLTEVIRIDGASAEAEDRFARLRLISWWDQDRLARAKVLVIGAGALGNEILKDLALLGVGRVFVADRDRVENSNLSRSILFRERDCGRPKALVAAERAAEIYPAIRVQSFAGNVVYDLGSGVYRWADVILGGLDNREARVAINQAAAKAGKIWIDGAIERLDGVARVFDPATGPCYECTLGETDWKMLEARRSCALLSRGEMELGKVPTTPTTASIIAGIQVQEAVKILHGLETIVGQGFIFDGTYHQSYVIRYTRKPDCPAHDPDGPVEVLSWRTGSSRVGDLLERVRSELGPEAVIETGRDLLASLHCPACGEDQRLLTSLGKITETQGRCPNCGGPRAPSFYHVINGRNAEVHDLTFEEIGIPPWDVLCGRAGMEQRFYEFGGDRSAVLGPLAGDDEPRASRAGPQSREDR